MFRSFVPISLLVTTEMVKFIQAIFMSYDTTMYSSKSDSYCLVNSSNLNEELGQIKHVFSDKTGTLTCNEMIFKKAIVAGVPYGLVVDPDSTKHMKTYPNVDFQDPNFLQKLDDPKIKKYLKFLSLCHMIITEEKDDDILYSSSSPDEVTLGTFARFCGYEFRGLDEQNNMVVRINGKEQIFITHYILEFTSKRKRQSVILEESDGSIWLYTKGADNVIFERTVPGIRNEEETINLVKNLDQFALEGLRTLVLAAKKVDREEFLIWREKYELARNMIEGKVEKMEELQDELERNLRIVGATAIEDKLQDQVPETIELLKKAGIKVWVLTGDKIETAKTIGFSCSLLTEDMRLHELLPNDPIELSNTIKECLISIQVEERRPKPAQRGVIISGDALIAIMESESLRSQVNYVASKCSVVLCCRVSPKQKQEVVELVKRAYPHHITLAIGDGANDVNMITEAHIGVGIRGLEGQQAARSSDFAIGEFKHLRRLVFVWGRESYRKNSIMVLYMFYKNVLLIMPQFWYAVMFNNQSGIMIFQDILYQFVNVVYTALPIILFAVFDRDCDYETLEFSWQYYFPGPKKLFLNSMVFSQWVSSGIVQSLIMTMLCSLINEQPQFDGSYYGFWEYGMIVFSCIILLANIKILNFSSSFSFMNLFIIFGSFGAFQLSFAVANFFPTHDYYRLFTYLWSNPLSYIVMFLVVCCCHGTDFTMTKFIGKL